MIDQLVCHTMLVFVLILNCHLQSLVAHSQFCLSGDHTLEATKVAIDNISKMEDMDEKFVVILSDANIERLEDFNIK